MKPAQNQLHGIANTVSIFDISYNGNNYLIGCFTDILWNSANDYHSVLDGNVDTFIFNLTSGIKQESTPKIWPVGYYLTYDRSHMFASFGGGGDFLFVIFQY